MAGDQSRIAPIMSKGDNVYSFGKMLMQNLQLLYGFYVKLLWDTNYLIMLLERILKDGCLNTLLLQISLELWKMPLV